MATRKQKAVANKIIEKRGKISVSKAMEEVGYSPNTVHNPSNLTKSKGWNELVEEFIPDDLILDALRKSVISPFGHVRNQAVDIAVKIKGQYQKEKENHEEIMELDALLIENKKLKEALLPKNSPLTVKN